MVCVSQLQAMHMIALKLLRWCSFIGILRLTLIKSCDVTEPGLAFIHKNDIFAMAIYLDLLNHLHIH